MHPPSRSGFRHRSWCTLGDGGGPQMRSVLFRSLNGARVNENGGYALPRSSRQTLESCLVKLYAISFLFFRGPVSRGNFLP